MKDKPKDIAASVHARLLAGANRRNENFDLTLQRYGAERFLYKLGMSRYREQFILKGALLFALWSASLYRATRDVDLTGYTQDDPASLIAIVKELCSITCPEDGLAFLAESVRAEPIRDKSEYHGFRVKLMAMLGRARIPLQVDVGFGDVVEPPAVEVSYPTLLDAPAPRIRAYPPEAVIAEKFHAMVMHGQLNSRFKDFYDLYRLANERSFDGPQLARAIDATFQRRRTGIDVQPVALSGAFYSDPARAAQWRSYIDRNQLPEAPADFTVIGQTISDFLGPVVTSLGSGQTFPSIWEVRGPWKNRS